jgi:hypothetical protein
LNPGYPGFSPAFTRRKKALKAKVHAHLNVLENLRINLAQIGSFLLPLCQDLVGFIERNRPLLLLPCVLSQCERIVIDPPAYLKQSCLRL